MGWKRCLYLMELLAFFLWFRTAASDGAGGGRVVRMYPEDRRCCGEGSALLS